MENTGCSQKEMDEISRAIDEMTPVIDELAYIMAAEDRMNAEWAAA